MTDPKETYYANVRQKIKNLEEHIARLKALLPVPKPEEVYAQEAAEATAYYANKRGPGRPKKT